MTTKFIKDYYYDFYNAKDKEGKRMLTLHINAILEVLPPKTMAMAIVALYNANHAMLDAEELNDPHNQPESKLSGEVRAINYYNI